MGHTSRFPGCTKRFNLMPRKFSHHTQAQDRAKRRRSLKSRVDRVTMECGLSEDEVAAYQKVFNLMDEDQSGSIQEEEILSALRAAGG